MIFGLALFVFGYSVFYWGVHHIPCCEGKDASGKCQCQRYSLWDVMWFHNIPGGVPAGLKTK